MPTAPLLPAPLLPAPVLGTADRGTPVESRTGLRSGNAVAPPAATSAAPPAGTPSRAPAPLRRGLSGWNPQLHKQLSDAQQAQDFLDQTAAQLQGLKADLSAKLTGLQSQDGQLEAKLQQLASTARGRSQSSAGSLDPQMRYSSPATATQRFSVRGLDLQTLTSGAGETLSISSGGTGRGLTSVSITPGLSADAIVQRFDRALAPSGIRATSDDSGALIFSVDESSWPAVRDNLSIKGDGIHFPTGQLTRVRADAEPAALQPEAWQKAVKSGDTDAVRRTLQQVAQALERVKQARSVVSRSLADAASKIDQARPTQGDAAAAVSLAANFQTVAGRSDYSSYSSVSAALVGISRTRVLALLALPPTP
jgi:hypothetical protein